MIKLLKKENPDYKYRVSYLIGANFITDIIKTDKKLEAYVRNLAIVQHFVRNINYQCISSSENVKKLINECKPFKNYTTYMDETTFIHEVEHFEILQYSDTTPVEVILEMDEIAEENFSKIKTLVKKYIKDIDDYEELTFEGFVECCGKIRSRDIDNDDF